MPSIPELLQNENTVKLIKGVIQIAGNFMMEQINGEPDEDKEQKILDEYYEKARQIAEKHKGAPKLKQNEIPQEDEEDIPEIDTEPDDEKASIRETKTTACVACIPPDSLIMTNPDVLPISNVSTETKVLDAQGEYTKVIETMNRQYEGELIEVHVKYQNIPLKLTPEHPVLVIKAMPCYKQYGYCLPGKLHSSCKNCKLKKEYRPEFVSAGELYHTAWEPNYSKPKEYLVIPRIRGITGIVKINLIDYIDKSSVELKNNKLYPSTKTKDYFLKEVVRKNNQKVKEHHVDSYKMIKGTAITNEILINKNFMKLIGFYLAEGHTEFPPRGGSIHFSFGKHEKNYISDVAFLLKNVFNVKADIREKKTAIDISVRSIILATFFSNLFGKGSHNKKIPLWMMTLQPTVQKSLLEGYFKGDGYKDKKRNKLSASTVSKQLAFSVRLLLFRLGIINSIRSEKTKESFIDGRQITSGNDQYLLDISGHSAIKFNNMIHWKNNHCYSNESHQAGIDKNYVYVPIKKIQKIHYDGPVMNLRTESNTYAVNGGLIVHNCSRNHIAAAAGLLAEGKRFLKDGLTSNEVLHRINLATQEIATMERGDLHPNKINKLPEDEKKVAEWIASKTREIRHTLDHISNDNDYLHAIDELTIFSEEITKKYYTMMEDMTPEHTQKSIDKICNGLPEEKRLKCIQTMNSVMST